jgi:hypothetical protein
MKNQSRNFIKSIPDLLSESKAKSIDPTTNTNTKDSNMNNMLKMNISPMKGGNIGGIPHNFKKDANAILSDKTQLCLPIQSKL